MTNRLATQCRWEHGLAPACIVDPAAAGRSKVRFSEDSCQCHAVVSWRPASSVIFARPPTKMGSGLSGSLLNRRYDVQATTQRSAIVRTLYGGVYALTG